MNAPRFLSEACGYVLGRCRSAAVVALVVSLGACATFDSYLDPAYTRYTLQNHPPEVLPDRIGLQVSYQANGVVDPTRAELAHGRVKTLIEQAGVSAVVPVEQSEGALSVLDVHVDHRFDADQAVRAGVATGASMGLDLATNAVRDEFSIGLKLLGDDDEGRVTQGLYEHAIVTTMKGGPPGIELVEYDIAFDRIMDDALAKFVHDRQVAANRPTAVIVLPEPPDLSEDDSR